MFGEKEVIEFLRHFEVLLGNGKCDMAKILDETDVSMIISNKSFGYLEVWRHIFANHKVKAECMNVLHVLEILLVTPFTNVKVERMFSQMTRTKTD